MPQIDCTTLRVDVYKRQMKETIIASEPIRFEGDGYSEQWKQEAARRGPVSYTHLVEFNHFFRIANTAPSKVCNVNQTIYATQVDKYTIGRDILNGCLLYTSSSLPGLLIPSNKEMGHNQEENQVSRQSSS